MDMPKRAGLYNVRLKRSSPHAREFLDTKAWYSPKSGVWVTEDLRHIVGTSEQVTARLNGVSGWVLWRFSEVE